MEISEKLQLIQSISGLTQEKLAVRLAVSFPTLNSWINDKSHPRTRAVERIDNIFREFTELKVIPDTIAHVKKQIIAQKTKKHKNILHEIINYPDIHDQFVLLLTYNTNRIEGSTLSEAETEAILFQNVSLHNKSVIEHMEAKNHQTALEFLFKHMAEKKPIDETLILKLHAVLMNSIRQDAGAYRQHGVRIVGSNVPTANYVKIPSLMKELLRDSKRRAKDVVFQAAEIHSRFEQIHPFSDGNGRIGRLLLHAMLLRKNLPPALIRQEKKKHYIHFLNRSQRTGDYTQLGNFFYDALWDGFKILERVL